MSKRSQRRMASVAAAVLAAALSLPAYASMETDVVSGAISFYECGDNCYLTILTEDGEELTGMCAAPACDVWNEVASMPDHMIGEPVTVTIEMGQQVDAEGNVMGEFPAFTDIVFEN